MSDDERGGPRVGCIGKFKPNKESIDAYLERVDIYLTANNFPNDRRVAAFLSIVGGEAYEVLRNLLAPAKPSTKSFDVLVQTLQKHYSPKPLVIAERFHFYRRNQNTGESIAEFEAALRKLALHCEFGDHLSEALRDRLVCGVRQENVQKRLLAEADLTMERAMAIAQGMEAADRNAKSFKGTEVTAIRCIAGTTNQRRPTGGASQPSKQPPCTWCNRSNHSSADCRLNATSVVSRLWQIIPKRSPVIFIHRFEPIILNKWTHYSLIILINIYKLLTDSWI